LLSKPLSHGQELSCGAAPFQDATVLSRIHAKPNRPAQWYFGAALGLGTISD
jgi:hypothetical protein